MKLKLNLKTSLILLLMICAAALALRTWQLSITPAGLTWDEAAIGYNAYSLIKTGRDEHGISWPLVFKSFGDYKPGVFIYWALPFIAALDLSTFSTRLPSAVAGVVAIVGIYLLSTQLFKSRRLGLLAAAVLAVSPWHIFYSRGAWEVNLFVTMLTFSLYFLVKSYEDDFPLWPSLVLAALTLYTYQAAKLLTLLVLGLIALVYWRKSLTWVRSKKWWLKHSVTLLLFVALVGYAGWQNLTGPAGNRLTRLSILGYQPGITQEQIDTDGPTLAKLFHSQIDLTTRLIVSRYTYHFAPEVLFYQGDVVTDRGHIPRMGMLYMVEALLLIWGVVIAYRKYPLLLGLLLIAPIPASLTLAEFSTTRSFFMIIPIVLLIALALDQILRFKRVWLIGLFFIIYLANIIYGLDLYFNHSIKTFAYEFNYGHKEAVEFIQRHPDSKVVFTDVYGQPYIYYLFYSKYDPATYQKQNQFIDGGVDVGSVFRVDQVEFRQFSLQDIQLSKNMVFVGSPVNLPNEILTEIDNLEYYQQIDVEAHKPIFRIVKTP